MTLRKLIAMGVDLDTEISVYGVAYDEDGNGITETDCSYDSETFYVNDGTLYIAAGTTIDIE